MAASNWRSRIGIAFAQSLALLYVKRGWAMKTSTVLSMALVSVSCYAAPLRTGDPGLDPGRTAAEMRAILAVRANAAPVSPPAPGVVAQDLDHAHWLHVQLPKSHAPSHGAVSQVIVVQT
jgi:hypothetical protein